MPPKAAPAAAAPAPAKKAAAAAPTQEKKPAAAAAPKPAKPAAPAATAAKPAPAAPKAAAPASSASSQKPAAAAPKKEKAPAGPISTTGIYVGAIDIRNQTAEEVRNRFAVFGNVAQLRVKRAAKVKVPHVLVWYKTAEEAKRAFESIKKAEPANTKVEWIKAARPVDARKTYATTLHLNPLNVPVRSSKGYGKLVNAIRQVFPEAIKTRLHKEGDGTGSAIVYFKDNAAANAAKKRIGDKLFNRPITVKPSCRNLEKDKKRFVTPLQDRVEYRNAVAAVKSAEEAAKQQTKLAPAQNIKDKALAKAADKKALDALKAGAKAEQKAAVEKATPNAAVKQPKETKQQIVSKAAAPAKTPPAHTAAKQPIQKEKTQSHKK